MSFDRGVSLGVFLFGAWVIYGSFHIPKTGMLQFVGPEVMPIGVGAALMVTAVALFVRTWRLKDVQVTTIELPEGVEREDRRTQILVFLGLAVYPFLLRPLGFIVATSLFCLYESTVFEARHWLRNVLASMGFSVGVYYLFVSILEVLLPVGILGW